MFARPTKHLYRLTHKVSILNTSQQKCHFAWKKEVKLYDIFICSVEKWAGCTKCFQCPVLFQAAVIFGLIWQFSGTLSRTRIACHLSVRNHETCPSSIPQVIYFWWDKEFGSNQMVFDPLVTRIPFDVQSNQSGRSALTLPNRQNCQDSAVKNERKGHL